MRNNSPNQQEYTLAMTSNTMAAEELVLLQEEIIHRNQEQKSKFQEPHWSSQAIGIVLGVLALVLLSRLSKWQSKRLQH